MGFSRTFVAECSGHCNVVKIGEALSDMHERLVDMEDEEANDKHKSWSEEMFAIAEIVSDYLIEESKDKKQVVLPQLLFMNFSGFSISAAVWNLNEETENLSFFCRKSFVFLSGINDLRVGSARIREIYSKVYLKSQKAWWFIQTFRLS